MLIRDLISLLEAEYKEQEKYRDMFGEPSIVIDVFDVKTNKKLVYCGFSNDIKITSSSDGCYRILTAWKEAYESNT